MGLNCVHSSLNFLSRSVLSINLSQLSILILAGLILNLQLFFFLFNFFNRVTLSLTKKIPKKIFFHPSFRNTKFYIPCFLLIPLIKSLIRPWSKPQLLIKNLFIPQIRSINRQWNLLFSTGLLLYTRRSQSRKSLCFRKKITFMFNKLLSFPTKKFY